jgi:tetratricopeptide (TPR) repeat protein
MKLLQRILLFIFFSAAANAQEPDYSTLKKLITSTKENADSLYFLNKQLLNEIIRLGKDKEELIKCYNDLSETALRLGNMAEAAEYASEATIIAERENIIKRLPQCYFQMSRVLNRQKKYSDALAYLRKGVSAAERSGSNKDKMRVFGQMGFNFAKLRLIDSALVYQTKALSIAKEIKDTMGTANCYSNIGYMYYLKGDIQATKEYYYKAYEIRQKSKDAYLKGASMTDCASLELEMGNYQKCITMTNEALDLIRSKKIFSLQMQCYESLAESYAGLKKFDSAFHYHKLYKAASDSVFNTENIKALTGVETRYQLNSKQNEIALLTEKNKTGELLVMREKMIRWIFIGGIILMFVILFMVFRQLKLRKEAFNKINEQKAIIEEKNKEIVDSIHYAKRIQSALMSSERQVDNSLNRLKKK